MHLNARSLLKNFDKFTQLLDSSQHEFSAIGISETWLNDINEDYVNITGYRFTSSNRVGRFGGGAGLYLRDTFNVNIMSDLCLSNSVLFDSVFVEIENPHGKNFIIGTVYCSPSANLHEFLESFHQLLHRVTRVNHYNFTLI